MKTYDNIHDAYLGTLADIYDNPDYIAEPRGQRTREKTDYAFRIINPQVEYIVTKDLERNKVIADYSQKEFDLYNSGSCDVNDFIKISKFWGTIKNPDNTVNSAYGRLIWFLKSCGNDFEPNFVDHPLFTTRAEEARVLSGKHEKHGGRVLVHKTKLRTPWEWILHCLRKDKDTRHAHLKFSLPEHLWDGNRDITCTQHMNFLIRDNKLNACVVMRSNDLTLGLVYDLPWFISLMYRIVDELKDIYPDLEVGHYTHMVHSLHIYDRDEDKILKMLGRV